MNQQFGTNPVQIYILHNTFGHVKIGVSTDFNQRLKQLKGSNGGGAKIDEFWASRPTLLYTLERVMHGIYQDNRIEGTEWFENLDFKEIVAKVEELMNTDEFKLCENVRKEFYQRTVLGYVY